MYQITSPKRTYLAAFILGASALVANSIAVPMMGETFVPVGNLMLFVAAGSLGLNATLVACAMALFPLVLVPGGTLEILRVLSICLALSFSTERAPRIPAFAVAMTLWMIIFAPFLALVSRTGELPYNIAQWGITVYALHEILLVLFSGALLLNSQIWFLLTGRPRHTPLYLFTTHAFTIISALCVFATLFAVGKGPHLNNPSLFFAFDPQVLMVVMCTLALAAIASYRFSNLLERDFQKFFHTQLSSTGSGHTFSGLSSDYWRRQSSTNLKASSPLLNDAKTSKQGSELVNSDKGVCALSSDGTVTFANRKFRELANLQGAEIVGKKLESISISVELKREISELLSRLEVDGPRTVEFRLNQIPNKLRFFELTVLSPDAYESSSIASGTGGAIFTLKEITDRRTVEEQLLRAQRLQSLGKVISGLGHAFNNSLTAITGHASVAKHLKEPKKIHENLDEIMKSSQAAGELVRKLLDFAEGEPSIMKVEDLTAELGSRLELLQKMVGDEYQLIFRGTPNTVRVSCDNTLLTQALTNLVLNSKEAYGGKPGKIEIELDTEEFDGNVAFIDCGAHAGNFARIRIRDHGVGMSRETLARAFDPLFTTKASSGHTGLGLSIVYAIVRAHDGFLAAESRPDKGTTVSVYIPVHTGAHPQNEDLNQIKPALTEDSNISTIKGQSERILVVEDEPIVRNLIAQMLGTLGYDVASCCNGVEALEHNSGKKFDLMLVDMVMPRMDGMELIERLRSTGDTAKTLVMTGYGITGIESSNAPILPKPFDMLTLAHAVRDALDAQAPSPLAN